MMRKESMKIVVHKFNFVAFYPDTANEVVDEETDSYNYCDVCKTQHTHFDNENMLVCTNCRRTCFPLARSSSDEEGGCSVYLKKFCLDDPNEEYSERVFCCYCNFYNSYWEDQELEQYYQEQRERKRLDPLNRKISREISNNNDITSSDLEKNNLSGIPSTTNDTAAVSNQEETQTTLEVDIKLLL
jgi:hypothetical protein